MGYNFSCHATEYGALFVVSADVSIAYSYWVKRPLSQDSRPVGCVTTSASDKGRFAMTAKDGKPCKKCGTSEWYKDRSCKECTKRREKRWHQKNKERKRELSRRWKAANKERVRETRSEWYTENRESILTLKRRWYRNNRAKCVGWSLEWAKRNPKKKRDMIRLRRARISKAPGSFTETEFKHMCDQYDNRCLRCGRTDLPLEPDHIIPLSWDGSSNDISNIQPLCGPCNQSKKDRHAIDYRTKALPKRWKQESLFPEEV